MGTIVGVGFNTRNYHGCTLVKPDEGTVFSMTGDSGAIYAVCRGGAFYPVAIHVTMTEADDGATTLGVGQKFDLDAVLHEKEWRFENPPQAMTAEHIKAQIAATAAMACTIDTSHAALALNA